MASSTLRPSRSSRAADAPRPTFSTQTIRSSRGAAGIPLRERRRRSRRAEGGLLVVALIAAWFGVRTLWARLTGHPAAAHTQAAQAAQARDLAPTAVAFAAAGASAAAGGVSVPV